MTDDDFSRLREATEAAVEAAKHIAEVLTALKPVSVEAPTHQVNLRELHDELHPPARSVSINLTGDNFSASSVAGLFERLNKELGAAGIQLVTTYTGGGGAGAPDEQDDPAE